VNRLVFNTNYIQLGPGDSVAQASNASFDAATFEIWGALLRGGRVAIVRPDVVLSPVEFAGQLKDHQVDVLFLTTALFNQMVREAAWGFQGLKDLLFGGQAVEPRWAKQLLEQGYGGRLLHVYGPTESTTFSSWQQVEDVEADAVTIPIGKPISNTEIYLLDVNLRLVPTGVTGEIYIGGEGLARGYLNRPGLTAEKFRPDPFGATPGARFYKTGDLACFGANGEIKFIGRVDYQVKVRGFRIELEEIEAVLGQHRGVQQAVVVAREDEPGEKRVVAYVVAEQDEALTPGEMGRFLKEKLPEYMVPSAFVVLDRLPLSPTGKIDRRALPEPDLMKSAVKSDYVAPRDDVERAIASVWQGVLRLEKVGIHDNFFDLGGHSLLLVQVNRKLRELFNQDLSMVEMFEHSTVSALATYINRQCAEQASFQHRYERAVSRREAIKRRRQFRKASLSPGEREGHHDE
jgi:acyl-CoA synthetase (AMP-forming)/AMP-acid ligase II